MKKNRKPQARKRTKETTDQLEFTNVVYMEKEKMDDKDNVYATCTCGEWRSSSEAKTFTAIGHEAKAHVEASKGQCALRRHAIKPEKDV